MKITKFIDFSQEVDIELDSEDIRLILSEEINTYWLYHNFNDILTFMEGLPDKRIEEIPKDIRNKIVAKLSEQLERFKK